MKILLGRQPTCITAKDYLMVMKVRQIQQERAMNSEEQSKSYVRSLEDHEGLDIDSLTEQIWNTFEGVIPRAMIRAEVEKIAPSFSDVRIKTYVPIFIGREVVSRLKNH